MTRALWTHLVKDLRIEWRSLDAIISMLFFALLVVVLFSIAFDPRGAFCARDCGRRALRGDHVCLGSALNQAWAREIRHQVHGRAAHGALRRGRSFTSAKVLANFLFVTIVQIDAGAVLSRLLQPAHRGTGVAAGAGAAAGHMGAGRQRSLLRRSLHPQPQPRTAAVADSVSHLHSRAAGHGAGHGVDPHGRQRPRLWIKMLLGYDIIFTTVSLLLFDVVFHAE